MPDVAEPLHVGIVGVSAEGAALCFRTLCEEGAELLGRHRHPEVTLHCPPLARYMPPIEAGDWGEVARLLLVSARLLAEAGAQLLICPDNTVHEAFDEVEQKSPRPWLHIARVVAASAAERGFRRLGVLGTRFLMDGPVYRRPLADRGIGFEVPSPADRALVDRVIFDDLVHGRFTGEARRAFGEVIERLRGAGCDAVVLGCTEIPLLISAEDSVLPVLDSTRLLARAALRRAVDAALSADKAFSADGA